VYKDLKSFSHLADVLPDKDLLTTPGHPQEKKYGSCAVVGNSGSLLETQYGDMIDNHDVVIRFNAAKTEGYVFCRSRTGGGSRSVNETQRRATPHV
jgi:hypothetical protein